MVSAVHAQTREDYKYSFQDSVRLVLENTKGTEAMTIATAFNNAWAILGPDQQFKIRQQAALMKKKGYKVRPYLVNYFGAIASAITIEHVDQRMLSGYLIVAGKVIEEEPLNQANLFFQSSRDFFENHALHFDKGFKLRAQDDDYTFEYLEQEIVSDTVQTVYTEPDTSSYNLPPWQQPVVQPEVLGPVIKFRKLSLNFITQYDSALLKNTSGVFSLRTKLFVGEGGRFDWSPAGISSDSVYYDLNKYHFGTAQPSFKAEQGKLTHVVQLAKPVAGIMEFKSINHKTKSSSTYPRFKSYESDINIKGLGSDKIRYSGGFGMQGNAINSNSVTNMPATIEVFGESEKKFKAIASSFGLKDSLIVSAKARIIIYQDNDSIVHPAMELEYDLNKQKLILTKENSQLRKAPFSSSFFDVDFTADRLYWNLKTDTLTMFIMGSSKVAPLIIESQDFYDPNGYRELRGQGFPFHPLALVVNYSNDIGNSDFTVFDLVVEGKRSLNQMKMVADFLSQKGMIDYDAASGKIHVKDKAIHMVKSVKGDADYDNLKVHSYTDTIANAVISFSQKTMHVYGVEEFNVSDSLNVIIKPDSSRITFLENRDINFNGTITAGNFEISGKDFRLKYDSFFINMNHIDSIRFYVTEKDGTRRLVSNSMVGADSTASVAGGLQTASNINIAAGTLFINRPDNKSGKENIPNYPRLDASSGGVVYFDRKEVLDGAYDRSFFFVVPPFKIDSLNDADPGSINFQGTFVSSGMFPAFKEKLHTMADKSLGFTHVVPATGYKLYQGDGKFYGDMKLDNSGIRSGGRIDFLSTQVESKDFTFYPDSVVAIGNAGEIKEKHIGSVYFPQVNLGEFLMKWLPKLDKMSLRNLKDPFNLYENTATLTGRLIVSKTGVAGDGRLTTRGSEVVSKELSFAAKDFNARHARFDVKTENPDKPALLGSDVALKFDLDENYATISPETEGEAAIEFPYAQFKTSIPEARWDLTTQKIVMTKAANVPIENSYFYTTRKDLDSLSFNAEKAEYDISSQQLKVSGIPYIIVADAKITPENNEVLILENARIGQLKNTVIVMDTINGYHRLTNGVVDIISRKEFTGHATYQYVNAAKDTFAIVMTDFKYEPMTEQIQNKKNRNAGPAMQTVANGVVTESSNILVAPRIYYKGDMTMYATKPALQLKGFVKMDLKKIKNYNTWLRYDQSGDEKEIYFSFDNSLTEENRKPDAGLHFTQDNSLYITFVFDKKDPADDDFFLPSGSLFFDKETGEFKIEDLQKAAGEKLSGKVFAYNEEKQEVRFEGPVTFFPNTKDFNLTTTALGSGSLETNAIKMNSFVMADMNIPPDVYQLMASSLLEVIKNESVPEGLGDQTELLYKIADIVGEKAVKAYEEQSLKSYTSLTTIPALVKPIVLANTNMKWSQEYKAFFSEGQLGLSHIGRNDINGAFEGFMEIKKNEDGAPVFHLFIKASPESWFYFGFEDNRLMIHSSVPVLNDVVVKKANAGKAKVGELVFIPGTDDETLTFINRYRQNYFGIEAPYDLSAGSSEAKKKEKKKEEDDGF